MSKTSLTIVGIGSVGVGVGGVGEGGGVVDEGGGGGEDARGGVEHGGVSLGLGGPLGDAVVDHGAGAHGQGAAVGVLLGVQGGGAEDGGNLVDGALGLKIFLLKNIFVSCQQLNVTLRSPLSPATALYPPTATGTAAPVATTSDLISSGLTAGTT